MRTVRVKVFCKLSFAAAKQKLLGLKTVETVCGESDEFTEPKFAGRVVEVHIK